MSISGLIFHRLLDVSKIHSMKFRKRLFCIYDRDLPYELTIQYNGLQFDTSIFLSEKSIRFQTPSDCQNEMKVIKEKQAKLKKFCDKISNEILNN